MSEQYHRNPKIENTLNPRGWLKAACSQHASSTPVQSSVDFFLFCF